MAKKLKSSGGIERLTEDMLIEVLLRLPMKLLLRCKSVSKSWLSLISSHRFAKSHLAITSAAAGNDHTLIVHVVANDDDSLPEEDGSFALFDLGSVNFGANLKYPFSQGVYPFEPPSILVGCDCGIVCVSVDVSDWPAALNKTDIYLWNPATKHSKRIPPHTIPHNDKEKVEVLGFGFDHVDFDFKVVRVVSRTFSAEVYSSNRNVWRKIELKPIEIRLEKDFHACFHGFLFTTVYNGLMAFDLNKEVIICDINLPVTSFEDDYTSFETRISDFKDSIAVIISMYKNSWEKSKFNLWMLDDEECLRGAGVKASWTLILSIDVGKPLDFFGGLFNNDEFLLVEDGGDRLLYYSDKKVARYVPAFPYFHYTEVFKYTESLFSVAGSKLVHWTATSSRLQDESDSDEESNSDDYGAPST